MPRQVFAHIAQDIAERVHTLSWIAVACVVVALALSLRHLSIKHDGLRWPVVARWLAVALAVSVAGVLAVPARTSAQDPQAVPGLPDLISDRPFIWFDKVVENPDGTLSRVLAFDGYLHNVGEGSLDLLGNPQIAGDVKQRVFDGESWEEVGAPTVRYETTDGHNHFHLIGAVDYSLWSESQARQIGESAKVGFCLVDSEQVEAAHDQFYDLASFSYCNEDEPEATELRMGITPGWRDTYDASTTLQWVDVSDVQPGRYWVGAITDPNDEIVESDEDNNGLVYSENTFPVSGFLPVPTATHTVDGETAIRLPAAAIATVGLPSWTITMAPRNGELDVPMGVALTSGTVTYRPDPGFTGTDSFSYQVRDSSRIFPLRPETQRVELDVVAADESAERTNEAPVVDAKERTITAPEFVAVDETFTGSDPDGDPVRWFAKNLPAGLRLDESTGVVSGVPTARGFYPSQIVAWDGSLRTTLRVTWDVGAVPADVNLWPRNRLDMVAGEPVWVTLGQRVPGARYEAEGMPDGVTVARSNPRVSGTPTEVGTFDIVVRELVAGVERQTVEFTWTVRPAAVPAFPL